MKLILSSDQAQFLEPLANLAKLKTSDRLKISAKKALTFLLLALVSVFVPVLHFFLVPLFLLLAAVFGIKAFSTQYRLQFEKPSACTKCNQQLSEEFLLAEDLRLKCGSCFAHYFVEK